MGTVDATELRTGLKLLIDGQPYTVIERQFIKPGKGAAFTRTKMKNLLTGRNIESNIRSGEKIELADIEEKAMSFLYKEGSDFVFMDQQSYEQITLPRDSVLDELEFLQPSATVPMLTVDGQPSGLQLPAAVELEVVETEPGVKGDTVSNVTKPATLETGAVVQVPLFVNVGDKLKVDPREGRYISRA